MLQALIIGPFNSGKTTLFNDLCGMRQSFAYYPNSTMEKKVGYCRDNFGKEWEIIDLPGIVSLNANTEQEKIACDILLSAKNKNIHPDILLCVLDANSLERQLALVLQLLGLRIPLILILNKADLLFSEGVSIDKNALSTHLGNIPILFSEANSDQGTLALRQLLGQKSLPIPRRQWRGGNLFEQQLSSLANYLEKQGERAPESEALLLLAGIRPPEWIEQHSLELLNQLNDCRKHIAGKYHVDADEYISRLRFTCAASINQHCIQRQLNTPRHKISSRIDAIALHPIGGWIVFLSILLFIFWSLFTWISIPSEWIANALDTLSSHVHAGLGSGSLADLLAAGIIPGIGAILSYLPQILFLFFALGIMEGSGYMARAACVTDSLMRRIGLPGRAFIPLLSAHACAVPAILSTRTINNPKDRLLTLLVLPWISCSARLPVYILITSLLFINTEHANLWRTLVLFSLYIMGILSALLLVKILRRPLTHNAPAHLLLELPSYRFPSHRYLFHLVWEKCGDFIKQAGTVIACFSIILWFLSSYPKQEHTSLKPDSYIAQMGHAIEPIFRPLGFDWRISTGIIATLGAREMFNAHMAILLAQEHNPTPSSPATTKEQHLLLQRAANTTSPSGQPLFNAWTSASLLLFFVYALQCVPTISMIRRETKSWKWALSQALSMCTIAYVIALIPQILANFFR